MKKYEIVKENKRFNDIINTGAYFKNRYFYIYYKDSDFDFPKFGLAVSKKCGNAVARNKLKRQLRMIIDGYKNLFHKGNDYIIITRKEIVSASFDEMEKSLVSLLKERKKYEKN